MIVMNFDSDAIITLGELRRDFRTREIKERISRISGPATVNFEMETHVGSKLREQLDPNISAIMEASAGPRKEQPEESDVLRNHTAENPIQQNTPGVQVPHVHKRKKGSGANNHIQNGSCEKARKLSLNCMETKSFTSKQRRVAGSNAEPSQPSTD
jgi:hypothetical protein